MHAIVCIKQVPDTTEVRIDPERGTLIREGVPSIINPFDMYAIEEGILLKEQHPDDNPIKAIFEKRQKERSLQLAIDMIRSSEIIPQCYRVAQDYTAEACRSLEIFPESPCRRSLYDLADYVVERHQ